MMKNKNMRTIISLVLVVLGVQTFAQNTQPTGTCSDNSIHAELVSINNNYEKTGFDLIQFKTVNLQSKALLPIVVEMQVGKMYQLNFLGNKTAKEISIVLFDKERNKLIDEKRKLKSDNADHLISVSFAAPYSGNYIVIISQRQKAKEALCAGFSILKGKG